MPKRALTVEEKIHKYAGKLTGNVLLFSRFMRFSLTMINIQRR
jgi:hypothetical protein